MKKVVFGFVLTFLISFLFFRSTFNVFFVQDDFILLENFSQQALGVDLFRAFGPPKVSHWRPIHNSFFLISGKLFYKNYFLYHFSLFIILSMCAFLIFDLLYFETRNKRLSIIAAYFFAIHPSHYLSIAWISGSAVLIGVLLFLISANLLLRKRIMLAMIFFGLSLLATEALIFQLVIIVYLAIQKKLIRRDYYLLAACSSIILAGFLMRILYLTPSSTFDAYKISVGADSFFAIKYYVLRVLGFADARFNKLLYFIPIVFFLLAIVKTRFRKVISDKFIQFNVGILIFGLLPFILIPHHASGQYSAIAVVGFSGLMAYFFDSFPRPLKFFCIIFVSLFFYYNIWLQSNNTWVLPRSKIAKTVLDKIQLLNPPGGSTLIIANNNQASSFEEYVSLGTGKAISFWFKGNDYKSCFTFFEICDRGILLFK